MSTIEKESEISNLLTEEIDSSSFVEFNVSKFLSNYAGNVLADDETDSPKKEKAVLSFVEICGIVKEELKNLIQETEASGVGGNSLLEKQHKAMIGNEEAKAYFLAKIEEVLRNRNIASFNYPPFFGTLSNAVFHEVWGWSLLEKWYSEYSDSQECMVIGKEFWIDIDGDAIRQKESFADDDVVERIKRLFSSRSQFSIINAQSPEVELEHEDGSRISMIQMPRGRTNYIVIRRFVVKRMTLEEQARRNTIPVRDVRLYKAISRVMPNIIVAGQIRSAKSTFMKTLIGERDKKYRIASLEKHFELDLKKTYEDRVIYELQSTEGDLHKAVPALLRMPHDFIVVGEIRSKEMEGYMEACERGERGAFGTYHLTFAEESVSQLTRHLLDEYPNRTYAIEAERVAKNLDFIISMAVDDRSKVKRVEAVTEVYWDDELRKGSTKDIVRYDRTSGKYFYSSKISPRLLYLMRRSNEEEALILMKILREREKESPMEEYNKFFLDDESWVEEWVN